MERSRIVTVFSLLFVLGMVNVAVGGPHALPRLPHNVAMMVVSGCIVTFFILALLLLINEKKTLDKETEEAVQRAVAEYEQRRAEDERRHQLRTDPNAPPETLAEQLAKKKPRR